MLTDGQVVDSSLLPRSAVECHPVTVSAESLMQTVTQSFGGLTGSQDRRGAFEFGPQESGIDSEEFGPSEEPVTQFRRIVLTDGAATLTTAAGAIPGGSASCNSLGMPRSLHAATFAGLSCLGRSRNL